MLPESDTNPEPSLRGVMEKRTPLFSSVIITIPTMLIGMWLFQKLKFLILPTITLAQSHVITIIFNTVLAAIAVCFIVQKREVLIKQLIAEIAHRKQFESALQESEERYRRIVETAYEGIWTLDREMKITYLNRRMAEMFGYSVEEMAGRRLFEFYNQDAQEQVRQRLELCRQGISEQFDIRTFRKDGAELWTLVNATPIRDSDNNFMGLLGMSTDITKRKYAEIMLQHHEDLLRDLSARLAEVEESERKRLAAELHDLVGQNLTALGINLNVIRDTIPGEMLTPVRARLHDCMGMVNGTIESIRNVITDLRPSTLDDFGLAATLHWYGELVAKRTGMTVTMHVEELSPRLPAPIEVSLFRIFQEALINVQKHAHATEVTVTLTLKEQNVRLSIQDNGIGFDTANTDEKQERKGWGLIMMAERATAAPGRLSIKSRPGQGTQIRVEVKR